MRHLHPEQWWLLHPAPSFQIFAARSHAHARHRQRAHFRGREKQNRRKARQLLAAAVQAQRMEEVTSALDVLLINTSTVEIGRELVQLAEWGELDTAALDRAVDEIITHAEIHRPQFGDCRAADCVTQTSGPLVQALELLVNPESVTLESVTPESETEIAKLRSWHCVKARIAFLDTGAFAPHPRWLDQLRERGWVSPTAPTIEWPPHGGWIARWSLTATGLREWAKIRKALYRHG